MGQRCKGKFIDTTFPVAKREPEKIQGCMGFKPFTFSVNPFAPGDFAEKRVLRLVEWFSGHCRAIKS